MRDLRLHILIRRLLLLIIMCAPAVSSAEIRTVEALSGDQNIATEMAYYATESLDDDLAVINQPDILKQFTVDGTRSLNRGFGTGSLWAVLDIKNRSDITDWYVVLSYPLLDEVDIWVETSDGSLTRSDRVGDSRPFISREIKTPQLVVPIKLEVNDVSRVFFRIKTNGSYYAPIRLHTGESLLQTLADEQTRLGVYFGGLIILALYNLILFIYFRQLQYLVLWGLAMGMVTWFLGETGLVMQYLVSSSPDLCNHLQILAMYSMGTLGLCLNYIFLREALTEWALKAHRIVIGIAIGLTIIAQLISYAPAVRIGLLLVAFYLIASFTFSLRAWMAGYKPARMFFISMLFAIGGGILIILRDIGMLAVGPLSEQGPSIGVGLFILLLSLSITDQISIVQRTKDALTESFAKFVPQRLVSQLVESGRVAHLGGERKDVTLIFSDIRGYSTIAEDLEPEQVIALLTEYFESMQESVEAHSGVILEYVGDGILAAFGVPSALEDHSVRAVECAIDMQNRLESMNLQWNEKGVARIWQDQGIEELAVRIGVHAGTVVAGNLGSQNTMKYGVVGDAVNVAARLEQLNNKTHTRILISQEVYSRLPQTLQDVSVPQGDFSLKGRKNKETIYSVGDLVDSHIAGIQSVDLVTGSGEGKDDA